MARVALQAERLVLGEAAQQQLAAPGTGEHAALFEHPDQHRVVRAGVHLVVELLHGVQQLGQVPVGRPLLTAPLLEQDQQIVGAVQDGVEPVQLIGGRVPGGEPGDQAPQAHLDLGQIVDGGVADRGDQDGARPDPLDEAVELQAAQRLADRGGADGQAFGHAALGHPLARSEVTGGDRGPDLAVRLVGERVRDIHEPHSNPCHVKNFCNR